MVNIRLARIGDCKPCCKLSEIKELETPGGGFISENYFKKNIDDDEMFFVAEDNDEIVGYILGEPMKDNMAFLSLLTIDKSQRGKGLGKKLLAKFEEQCHSKKLNPILFYAPRFNENTIAFYNKQGYIQGKDHVQFMKVL
ncbi:MAG: GNAT family N-acetyltransferase [Candidatus Woesearchaeota archaeon]